jgi:phosphoserine phosphatase RsbU/P
LRSGGVEKAPEDPRQVQTVIAEKGVPIVWSFIGLEQGVMFAYPGKTGYPKDFDPRQRPWYALGTSKPGLAWGNPYADALGMGLLLPSAMALRGDNGKLLGVAGVECTFDYIIEHLMALPGMPAVKTTFIVDDKARVVVSSARKGERVAAGKLTGALELPTFPIPEVAKAITAGGSGVAEVSVSGKPALVAYNKLQSLGWYFVVLADPGAI